jgi:hypothetical protein
MVALWGTEISGGTGDFGLVFTIALFCFMAPKNILGGVFLAGNPAMRTLIVFGGKLVACLGSASFMEKWAKITTPCIANEMQMAMNVLRLIFISM